MAILRPALDQLGQLLEPLNAGELRVARQLASQLDDEWTVYVQPRLGLDMPDFVAVHDEYGACVIEVKDWAYGKYRIGDNGMVECRNGQGWERTEQHPRYQAERYRSEIFQRFFASPDDGTPVGPAVRAVVLLLNHSTRDARKALKPVGMIPALGAIDVYGEDHLHDLTAVLIGRTPARPSQWSLDRLRQHLAYSDVVLELQGAQRLSDGARNIESNANNARMRRVRGPAGCGKSFGLAARAARLAAQGKSVLVLSYNITLAHYLETLVASHARAYGANPRRVTCTHFHGFCARVADDAKQLGMPLAAPKGVAPFNVPVANAQSAFENGFERTYDAILVDEGQDFRPEWWNLLRQHVLADDGEMLLVVDPTQDMFGNKSWTDVAMSGAGFSGPWTELSGSYRLPWDMVRIADEFCRTMLRGEVIPPSVPADQTAITGRSGRTERSWIDIKRQRDLGKEVGEATVALLDSHPGLEPSDVVLLCETHEQGLRAVEVIEAAGHYMHHIFATDPKIQKLSKHAFWPTASGIKGCTVASFKGWESRVVVMGIGAAKQSRQAAYVAMTRLKGDSLGRSAYVTVVNADSGLRKFGEFFVQPAESWPPPQPQHRAA